MEEILKHQIWLLKWKAARNGGWGERDRDWKLPSNTQEWILIPSNKEWQSWRIERSRVVRSGKQVMEMSWNRRTDNLHCYHHLMKGQSAEISREICAGQQRWVADKVPPIRGQYARGGNSRDRILDKLRATITALGGNLIMKRSNASARPFRGPNSHVFGIV